MVSIIIENMLTELFVKYEHPLNSVNVLTRYIYIYIYIYINNNYKEINYRCYRQ